MTRFSAIVWAALVIVTVALNAQQGPVRHSMASPAEPVGPAHGWAVVSGETQALLTAQGAAARLTDSVDLTVFQPAWTVTGSFTVSALFERLPDGSSTAAYGLTVGTLEEGSPALAFLMRPDGTMTIQRGATPDARTPLAGRVPTRQRGQHDPEGPLAPIDRLEVRVRGAEVEFLANGQSMGIVPIEPGELDGHAGVHASAGAAVLVSGFTLEGSVTAVQR